MSAGRDADLTEAPPRWSLQGITSGRGACDHCDRTLSRLFRVMSPGGECMQVGRVCAATLTGYRWSVAQAERIEATVRRDAAATEKFGLLYTDLKAQAALTARRYGTSGAAGEGAGVLRDLPAYMTVAEAEAFARRMLAVSIAREGAAGAEPRPTADCGRSCRSLSRSGPC